MSPTCEIQWVDAKGVPTPDTNEAVCLAVSMVTYPGEAPEVRAFPCCRKHAWQLDELVARGPMRLGSAGGTSQWTRESLS